MAQQENNIQPIGREEQPIIGADYIHIKTKNIYRIIDCKDKLIKLNGKWHPGVIYNRLDNRGNITSNNWVRFIEDFQDHFAFAFSPNDFNTL